MTSFYTHSILLFFIIILFFRFNVQKLFLSAASKRKQIEQLAKTQERLTVRRKLKMNRTMHKVPGFDTLSDDSISKIIDKMNVQKFGGSKHTEYR